MIALTCCPIHKDPNWECGCKQEETSKLLQLIKKREKMNWFTEDIDIPRWGLLALSLIILIQGFYIAINL